MSMVITEHIVRHVTVSFTERLDAFRAPRIRAELETLRVEGVKHFTFDLSHVQFLDSAGLAILVNVLKWVQQEDGSAKMVLPEASEARRVLRLTRFDRIFEVVGSNV